MNLSYGMIIFQVHREHTAQLDLEKSVEINFIIVILGLSHSVSLMEFWTSYWTFFIYAIEEGVWSRKALAWIGDGLITGIMSTD